MRKASFLRKQIDKLKPYTEGNPFLHTVFDGLETLLYTPKETTHAGGTHIKDGMDLKRTMIHVVLAMQLAFLHGFINVGHQHYAALGMYPGLLEGIGYKVIFGLLQVLPIIAVVHLVGLGIEFLFAAKKGHSIEEGFLVSAFLIPLIMPPDIPLWIVAIATAFAVVIAKEAFGGTGMNILNIALTARVFIFFAYPTTISGAECWIAHDYNILHHLIGLPGHAMSQLGIDILPEGGWRSLVADGFTGATPLGLAAEGGWSAVTEHYSIRDMLLGFIPGSIGEVSKPLIIIGAIMLIAAKIASWRIMLSMIVGAVVAGLLFNLFGKNEFMQVDFYYHFLMGSFFFAMAFMATDPVTAATTGTGKLIYGFLIGVLGMIIRVMNPAYPEGWMLAILFMNVFAPLIDHYVLQGNIRRRLARVG